MSLFAPDVGREIQRYIEGLCDVGYSARPIAHRNVQVAVPWQLVIQHGLSFQR